MIQYHEIMAYSPYHADAASAVVRFCVGVFFSISGFHKLFVPARHAKLRQTLIDDGIPHIKFNEWFVPGVEFIFGATLAIGFLSMVSAALLFVICLVALFVDGLPRIQSKWSPINRADWLCCCLYLPETLYMVGLAAVLLIGPGSYSIDYYLWR